MIRLRLWDDLMSFLMIWPLWRQMRHAPQPSVPRLRLEYELAKKAHRGQRKAYARLKAARHLALAWELSR